MINQDKPGVSTPATKLNVGSGFTLLVGGIYKLLVGSASTTGTFANTAKASIGETWATISTTWATETRTWIKASQLLTNPNKPTSVIINTDKPS